MIFQWDLFLIASIPEPGTDCVISITIDEVVTHKPSYPRYISIPVSNVAEGNSA